jgi:hypothetical protein
MNAKTCGKSDEQEPRRRWEDVINICVRETGCKGVDWIQQAVVNTYPKCTCLLQRFGFSYLLLF